MKSIPVVAIGAALGGCVRFGGDLIGAELALSTFPVATFFINVSGSFLIGYLAGIWSQDGRLRVDPNRWHFWVTGFCGGFTTFSTYVWQILEMLRMGEGQAAGLYAAASVGFGLMAVWLGLSLSVAKRNRMDQTAN